MPTNTTQKNPAGLRLIRSVNGKERAPGEIDIDRAIDQSSSATTLADLTRRGYSSVRVLDRKKIEMLIARAVREAIEHRVVPPEQQHSVEVESRQRFESLLRQAQRQPAAPVAEPPAPSPGFPDPASLAALTEMIVSALRPHLAAASAAGHGGPAAGGDGAVRLDAIEQRLARLTEALDRAERTIDRVGSVSYGPSRHGHYRRDLMANALDKQRSTILEGIFKNNLQLQVVEAGLTTKQNAAQTAEAPHSEGVIE